MSIEQEVRIATLEAELEMERARTEKYKGLHDLAKGRVNNANEHIDLITNRNKELEESLINIRGIAENNMTGCGTCSTIIDFMAIHHRELEDDPTPQTHHVKPISAERIGEIVEKVRGRG